MDIYNTVNYMKTQHKTIFDLEIRVTYYVRVSTLKEEQDSSVENQILYFEQIINNHPNWTYINGYVDRVRAESATNRENFMRMIEDGKNNKFDLILTKEVSRFARNTIDSLTYTRDLLRVGVGVFFQNDNICTVDSDAEFRLTIMSSIAQDEVRKLSERVRFGHKQSIEKGVVMGNSRIYGYDKNNGKLVINPKEAEMVKMIFNWYASGKYALRAIERKLYDLGYRSRNGKKIEHNTINTIIKNPKYKGYYCGNKVKIADYRTKEQVFLPEKDWIMYKDETGQIVPPIVSEELWDIANSIMKERSEEIKRLNHGKKATSVLSGKIYCKHHNTPFWRTSYSHRLHKDKNIYQWVCREKKRGKSDDCPTFAIYETELYNILSGLFIDISNNLEDCIATFVELCKECDDSTQINNQIKDIKNAISKLEKKKDKLLELYMDEAISKTDYKIQNDKLNKEIVENSQQITRLSNYTNTNYTNTNIIQNLNNIKNFISSITNNKKKTSLTNDEIDFYICNLVDKIYIESIDKHTLSIDIVIKNDKTYRTNFVRSSGHTSFTI